MRKLIILFALLLLSDSIKPSGMNQCGISAVYTVNALNTSLKKLEHEIHYNNSRIIDTIVVRNVQENK